MRYQGDVKSSSNLLKGLERDIYGDGSQKYDHFSVSGVFFAYT
jgi:hypothetical protein